MLFLATVALVMPALVDLVSFGSLEARPEVIDRLSFWTSLRPARRLRGGAGLRVPRRSRDPLRPRPGHRARPRGSTSARRWRCWPSRHAAHDGRGRGPGWGARARAEALGMTELFAGVIVIALVGNAAEHYSAVTAAGATR